MKKIAIAAIGVGMCVGAASAADMGAATPQAGDWTGFYVGGYAGYAWGQSDPTSSVTCGPALPIYINCSNQNVVQSSGSGSLSPNGFTGGVRTGYNFQAGNWVYGGELDFGAFNVKASRTTDTAYVGRAAGAPFTTTVSTSSDWLLTARGRLGWTVTPDTMLYGTGGLALTNFRVGNSFGDSFGAAGASSNSATKAGWTVGGGAEWMLSHNWSVSADYLYVNFGRVTTVATIRNLGGTGTSELTTSAKLNANIVRLGLNYRF